MMSHRILPAALLLCTLAAACGENPTGSDTQAQPAGPAYDGGYGMGSGNSATQSSGYTIGSGSVAEDEGGFGIGGVGTDNSTTTSDETTERGGGFTIGSGG
jgi:hypothetical protein